MKLFVCILEEKGLIETAKMILENERIDKHFMDEEEEKEDDDDADVEQEAIERGSSILNDACSRGCKNTCKVTLKC